MPLEFLDHQYATLFIVSKKNILVMSKAFSFKLAEAENRANVIQQLQLMDEVAGGRKQLSPNQMNNIYFAAVTQFFSENGIQRKSK